ncbi:hypothetical protein CBM2586_A11368 [Cupriavidus phytorum]|uniref:Transposase n=1 Tax=Cupriavidus taiwanensis TaxID=164546 RepID=A0A975ZWZ6_9BURK|nr:hypothetical protein CBM2586_A11368 [Cupriavidus taiwanensis]
MFRAYGSTLRYMLQSKIVSTVVRFRHNRRHAIQGVLSVHCYLVVRILSKTRQKRHALSIA